MLSPIIVALALSVSYSVAAAPPQGRDPLHIPVVRRHNVPRGGNISPEHISAAVEGLKKKYGYGPRPSRRAQTADIGITDQNQDTSYFAQVDIGTPAQNMQVVLDTGSSDLWVTTTDCASCSVDTPLFDSTKSSSFKKGTTDIPLSYGSGSADGTLAQDTVSMGPFTVNSQAFVVVDSLTSGLIDGRMSGIMGLAFEGIANTAAPPFWQALLTANELTNPEFSFFITRFVNDASAGDEEPGGVFTLGGTNSTFFEGDPDFQTFTSSATGGSFWLQTISDITVNGASVSIGTGKSSAIDTGTTLIGGPTTAVTAIWSSIPDAQALSGQMAGFWAFPCDTKLNVSMSFGGPSWPISNADLSLGTNTDGMCVGAIFDIEQGTNISPSSGVPSWIVGDTFLKNVYTVFRADPPAVGFAKLSAAAAGASGNPNSPSVATASAKGSGSGTGTRSGSSPTGTGSPRPGGASWAAPLGIPGTVVTSALSLLTAIFVLAA